MNEATDWMPPCFLTGDGEYPIQCNSMERPKESVPCIHQGKASCPVENPLPDKG